jgi:glycosyltransferase involved in cell wall biosynthesis
MDNQSSNQASPMSPSISVVIAAYNEAENLELVLKRTLRMLQNLTSDYEVLIIDDGSQDSTREISNELAAQFERVEVIHHGQNRGFGAALITGYANARGDLIAPLPADGQIPPEEIASLLGAIQKADLVIADRPDRSYNLYRRLLHWGMTSLDRLLFGDHPPSAGSCMFRRQVFQSVYLVATSGFANTEFSMKVARQGYRTATVPIKSAPRLSGQSKVSNLKTILITLRDILRVRMSLR